MSIRTVLYRVLSVLALFGLVISIYLLGVRPSQLRWGATDEELARAMPADEIALWALAFLEFIVATVLILTGRHWWRAWLVALAAAGVLLTILYLHPPLWIGALLVIAILIGLRWEYHRASAEKTPFIQLLTLTWVTALLVSCVSHPPPTTQPTATKVSQGSAPEPTKPAAMETQEPAATKSSSMDEDTALPEEEIYWPTEAWRVAAPDEQGMDAALLGQMLNAINEQNLNIDSVVVVHNGYIVTEKYYSPYKQDYLHDVYSITKSVVSALIGIAIQEGYINSVDDSVLDFFPERTFENDDALKRSITLEHLLTMSSGLEWDWDEMVSTRDWVQYVLDQPMTVEPGTEFYFSSGNAHVLSAIIQEASGLNTLDFAQLYLFDPLGISDIRWKTDLDGIPKGGWGMAMKPRDMAKLGYLYLNQGMWDGQQIIPAEWIAASTERYVQVPEPLEPWDLYMGYLWWLHEDGPYAAHGMQGQFIYVIPESDLVVVFTSNITDAKFAQPQLLIRDYVIPAVTAATE